MLGKNLKQNKYLIFLVLLSLTPLVWFYKRPGVLISGSDTNFPLDPITWFQRRFFVWQSVSNAGSDFSSSTAGTFFHFLQFIVYRLGLSLQTVEIVNLVFWFSVILFSSWFLARQIFAKRRTVQIIFVLLYSLNIYLFNTWENIKVANLALVSAIPLGFSILILLREGKISRGFAAILSIITGIILSGAGINPAYIICFFLILGIFVSAEVFVDFGNWRVVLERVFDFLIVGFFIAGINSFWILPTLNFIFSNITATNSINKLGFVNWVNSLSQNTSIVNVLRMQGAWDWYSVDSVTKIPLYIPYAVRYFYNPLFISFSFLVPSLAFLAFVLKRKNFNLFYISFGIMLIVGIFLCAGTHQPTGAFFEFFSRHIPFFTLFRSPWYIFAPLIGISVAGLVSILFYNLYFVFEKKTRYFDFVGIFFVICLLIYSYPLIFGRIFRPNLPDNFYIKFPDYVSQTDKWLKDTATRGRILSYPDDNIERFTWGYGAVDSILNLFSDREVIYSSLNDTTSPLTKMTSQIYESLKRGEMTKANALADRLGIGQIFYKKDQISIAPDLPDVITQNKIASFGKWLFYNFPTDHQPTPAIYTADCCSLSYPYEDSYLNQTLLPTKEVIVNPNDNLLNIGKFAQDLGVIVHAKNSQMTDYANTISQTAQFGQKSLDSVEYDFEINQPGSYQPVLQKYGIGDFGVLNQGKFNVVLDGKSSTLVLNNQDDSYLYFDNNYFAAGKHELLISYQNKNLVNNLNFSKNGNGIFDYSNGIFTEQNRSMDEVNFSLPVEPFDFRSLYLVTFSYKHIFGETAEVIGQQGNSTTLLKNDVQMLPNYPEWEDFGFYYTPVETNSNLNIHLIAPPIKEVLGTKVQYTNINAYKVFSNDLFFKKDGVKNFSTPTVNFKKDSSVLYTGQVVSASGPHIIVFDANYSPGWEFHISGNSSTRVFHFTANSYENAWYIDGVNGSYNFSITYGPQKLLKFGYILSGISIVVAISFFIYVRLRKNERI